MNNQNLEVLKDMLRQQQMELESCKEEYENKALQVKVNEWALALGKENEKQKEDLKEKDALLKEKDEEIKTLKMQNSELGKISQNLVKKTDSEVVVKMIRCYMNSSRRKTAKKRGYIKMMILEMTAMAKVSLPEDMMAELETFDDDEAKSQVINTKNIEMVNPTIEQNNAPINIKELKSFEVIDEKECEQIENVENLD